MAFPKTNLSKVIRLAFANSPYPIGDLIIQSNTDDPESTEMKEVFNNRLWYEITFNEVSFWCSNLPRFTDSAFKYFLPAFLLHSLDNRSGDMSSYIYFYLTQVPANYDTDFSFEKRMSLFNDIQKNAILRYVEYEFKQNNVSGTEYDKTVSYWRNITS